jgi:hypothetical protein
MSPAYKAAFDEQEFLAQHAELIPLHMLIQEDEE